eukprot:SAG11_NODE_6050_length_1399_cov_1.690769_2_plen_56_part_00
MRCGAGAAVLLEEHLRLEQRRERELRRQVEAAERRLLERGGRELLWPAQPGEAWM